MVIHGKDAAPQGAGAPNAGKDAAQDQGFIRAALLARLDGRNVNLNDDRLAAEFCPCDHRYKWAKFDNALTTNYRVVEGYTNVKCYNCGNTQLMSIHY